MADLKDQVLRFFKEVFDNRNLDAVDDLLTKGAIDHEQPPPGLVMPPGREGVKALIKVYLDAFSPLNANVQDVYQDGDTVITRTVYTGTHTGVFAGIAPTGKTFSVEGIDILRCEGDKLAEHWSQFDAVGMMTQLGLLPPM
jgi:predicted SnoaL-like aldol condensation-catalyzing enzyme